jgi:hypothetical protein
MTRSAATLSSQAQTDLIHPFRLHVPQPALDDCDRVSRAHVGPTNCRERALTTAPCSVL